jgi:hypothetical protein
VTNTYEPAFAGLAHLQPDWSRYGFPSEQAYLSAGSPKTQYAEWSAQQHAAANEAAQFTPAPSAPPTPAPPSTAQRMGLLNPLPTYTPRPVMQQPAQNLAALAQGPAVAAVGTATAAQAPTPVPGVTPNVSAPQGTLLARLQAQRAGASQYGAIPQAVAKRPLEVAELGLLGLAPALTATSIIGSKVGGEVAEQAGAPRIAGEVIGGFATPAGILGAPRAANAGLRAFARSGTPEVVRAFDQGAEELPDVLRQATGATDEAAIASAAQPSPAAGGITPPTQPSSASGIELPAMGKTAAVASGSAPPGGTTGVMEPPPRGPGAPAGAAPGGELPPTGVSPVAKLVDVINQTRPLPAQTELMRSQARRQRVAIGASQLQAGGRTPEAYARARGALAGEMPRTGFEPPAQQFAPEEVQQLRDQLGTAGLRFFEEVNAEEALSKVLDGRLNEVRDFELSLLDRVYGPELSLSIADKMAPPTFREKIFEYWLANILSGFKTQARNILGNTATAMTAVPERLGAAAVDLPVSAITGRPRERFFAEADALVRGFVTALPEGVRGALHVFKEGFNPNQIGRIEQRRRAIGGPVGRLVRLPLTGLEAMDTFFKAINSEAAYRALAVREAKQAGLKGDEFMERVAELLANRPDDLLDSAFKQSEAWLFRDDPTRVGKAVLAARQEFPPLGFIIPFARTPDRLIAYGIRRSPLGLFDAPMWKRLFQGNPEAVDELTQTLMGSAIATSVAGMVAAGMTDITAGVPFDEAERDRFYREGKQPFSINIGGRWIQYNQIPALAETLTMVAGAVEAYREGGDIDDIAARAVSTIGQSIADRSYMSGMADFMDAVMDPGRYGERFITRWAGGFVPGSGFLRQTAQSIDPTVRQPKGFTESIETGIPGLSQNVPPRLTAFGEEARRASPASPITISRDQQIAVDRELEAAGIEVQFAGDSVASRSLNRDQKQAYQRAAGRAVYERLYNVVNTPLFQSLTPAQKAETLDGAIDKARGIVRTQISEYVDRDRFKALPPATQEELFTQFLQQLGDREARGDTVAPEPPSGLSERGQANYSANPMHQQLAPGETFDEGKPAPGATFGSTQMVRGALSNFMTLPGVSREDTVSPIGIPKSSISTPLGYKPPLNAQAQQMLAADNFTEAGFPNIAAAIRSVPFRNLTDAEVRAADFQGQGSADWASVPQKARPSNVTVAEHEGTHVFWFQLSNEKQNALMARMKPLIVKVLGTEHAEQNIREDPAHVLNYILENYPEELPAEFLDYLRTLVSDRIPVAGAR